VRSKRSAIVGTRVGNSKHLMGRKVVPESPVDHSRGKRRIKTGQEVASQCWCMKEYVQVSIEDVSAGRTASCGRDNCKEG
jgi:hypothetical protein